MTLNHNLLLDFIEELKSFIKGKTVDAMLPPLVFMICNALLSTSMASVIALILALALFIRRLIRKEALHYAMAGLATVLIALAFVRITGSASSYLIPSMITTGLLGLITLFSLVINRPLAAFLSHLTRGWTIHWFWRQDILPAYREVTILWLVALMVRVVLQVIMYLQGDATKLFIINFLLGTPVTLIVMTVSYIYGIRRLKQLHGPSIDEYVAKVLGPWKSQSKSF